MSGNLLSKNKLTELVDCYVINSRNDYLEEALASIKALGLAPIVIKNDGGYTAIAAIFFSILDKASKKYVLVLDDDDIYPALGALEDMLGALELQDTLPYAYSSELTMSQNGVVSKVKPITPKFSIEAAKNVPSHVHGLIVIRTVCFQLAKEEILSYHGKGAVIHFRSAVNYILAKRFKYPYVSEIVGRYWRIHDNQLHKIKAPLSL